MDLRFPEISATVQTTVRASAIAKLVTKMVAIDCGFRALNRAHADSIEVVAHVRLA